MIGILHMIYPNIVIDAITISLIVIAIVPWLGILFKSLELPGGLKVEYKDIEKVRDEADKAGFKVQDSKSKNQEFVFLQIADRDPNLALAGLRIEIEKRLIKIAQSNNIVIKNPSVYQLLRILGDQKILTDAQTGVLSNIIGILNNAVHGASIDKSTSDLALELGLELLGALDSKISGKE